MIIGYLPDGAQTNCVEKLQAAGCQETILGAEIISDLTFSALISRLQSGDMLVLCQLDHIGTMTDLIQLMIELGKKKVHTKVIAEDIDTLRDTALFLIAAR